MTESITLAVFLLQTTTPFVLLQIECIIFCVTVRCLKEGVQKQNYEELQYVIDV